MDRRIAVEQNTLEEKIKKIDQAIEALSSQNTIVTAKSDYTIIERRKERIRKYKEARPSPYVGRVDLIEPGERRQSYYIGHTGIANADETEIIVMDWRSDVAKSYTSYSGGTMDLGDYGKVIGKRLINIHQFKISKVVDVGRVIDDQTGIRTGIDSVVESTNEEFLAEVLAQSSDDYRLKDIVASIQKEQDEIIRLPLDQLIMVQGVAGSGKSSIALHRISYLLYRYRETLKPEHILIIAPNRMFLSYIQSLMPILDIRGIEQSTFADFAAKRLKVSIAPPRKYLLEGDELKKAKYKNSIQFSRILNTYMQSQSNGYLPRTSLLLNFENRKILELSENELRKLTIGYNHLPINKRREKVLDIIKDKIDEVVKKESKSLEDDYHRAVSVWVRALKENSQKNELGKLLEKALKNRIDELHQSAREAYVKFEADWQPANTLQLYYQMFDPNLLKFLDRELDETFASYLCNDGRFEVGLEDVAALLFIEEKVNGVSENHVYKHIVVDEAQDLSPFQLMMLSKFATSMTILGDVTQSIHPFGVRSWDELMPFFERKSTRQIQLRTSYRSTREIIETANLIIKNSGLNLPMMVPVNRSKGKPAINRVVNSSDLLAKMLDSISNFRKHGYRKIAIIGKTENQMENIYESIKHEITQGLQLVTSDHTELKEDIVLIPSLLAKGVEFDAVIIPNAGIDRYELNEMDAKLLFISVTRALHELHIYYHGQLTPLLQGLTEERLIRSQRDLL